MATYNFIDRTGQTFGRLKVTKRAPNKNGRTMWECICDCGNTTIIRGEHLRNKASQSCGCLHDELKTKHGQSRTGEYYCWQAMKDRCTNPDNKSFKNYGERGISVCERWLESFDNFISDMGQKPNQKYTIERIDNEKGYAPENCKWATRKEQVVNRRNSILHTIDGETKCLKDWCSHYGKPYSTTRNRIKRGMSIDEALSK